MAAQSKIQWTDATWNVAVGCDKVSEGCKFCYMMRDFGGRLGQDVNGNVTRTSPTTFGAPIRWQRGKHKGEGGRPCFPEAVRDTYREGKRNEGQARRKPGRMARQVSNPELPRRIRGLLKKSGGAKSKTGVLGKHG